MSTPPAAIPRPRFPDSWIRFLLILAPWAAAGLVLLACAPRGAVLQSDTEGYVRLARRVLRDGFAFWSENTATTQPPLYALSLAGLARVFHVDPLAVMPGLNAVCLLGVGLLARRLARLAGLAPAWQLGLTASVLAYPPLCFLSFSGLSEPLFTVLLSAAWLLALSPTPGALALATLAAALAALTRYVGLVLLAPLCLLVLATWWTATRSLVRAAVAGAVFGLLAALPVLGVLARNHSVSGSGMGVRYATGLSPGEVLGDLSSALLSGFLPGHLAEKLEGPGLLAVFLPLFLAAGLISLRAFLRDPARARFALAIPLVLSFYLAFLTWAACWSAFDRIGPRLVCPVHVWLMPWLWVLAGTLLPSGRWRSGAAWLLSGLLLPGLALCAKNLVDARRGEGLRSDAFAGSPALEWVRRVRIPAALPVYSNRTDALLLLAGLDARKWPKRMPYDLADPKLATAYDPARDPGQANALWIWFVRKSSDIYHTPESIAAALPLRELVGFPDAVIYHTGPLPEEFLREMLRPKP